jgi:hypothetical protein
MAAAGLGGLGRKMSPIGSVYRAETQRRRGDRRIFPIIRVKASPDSSRLFRE